MIKSACLGMPRVGSSGEVCDAVSSFIKNKIRSKDTKHLEIGTAIRKANWQMQLDIKIDLIPCNDFTIYDHVLDTSTLVGNIPHRYFWEGGAVPPEIYFSMILGQQKEKFDVHEMPLCNWLNTPYSFVVPEFSDPTNFAYSSNEPIAQFLEARKTFNIETIPNLLGIVSYILLGQNIDTSASQLIAKILPVYEQLFQNFMRLNIKDVRFDEPYLTKDLTRDEQDLYRKCYSALKEISRDKINIHVVTSHGSLGSNFECAMSLDVQSIHYDFVNGKDSIDDILSSLPKNTSLSVGLVNANDGWINNISQSLDIADKIISKIGSDRVIISTSSSLFLCPLNVELETTLDQSYKKYLAFAKQKLEEVVLITKGLNKGRKSISTELAKNEKLISGLDRLASKINKRINESIQGEKEKPNRSQFKIRKESQSQLSKEEDQLLPLISVGAMPSKSSLHNHVEVPNELELQIIDFLKIQAKRLDVVHSGEIERRTNVEYFANLINGISLTTKNITQLSGNSYISRPILHDVSFEISDHYLKIAQLCLKNSTKPVRFSLIGPVSLVNMCFVPSKVNIEKCYIHFAHLIGKQIEKLQEIGIRHIVIDEPSLMQNAPLRNEPITSYIKQLSEIFKICSNYALDETQICLKTKEAPFEEYIEGMAAFDADILELEGARSKFKILNSLIGYKYPNDIAIGVFNPNSARLPTKQEIKLAIHKFLRILDDSQIKITTDTSHKTRNRSETITIIDTIASTLKELRKLIQHSTDNE